jgi:hypothetical protein
MRLKPATRLRKVVHRAIVRRLESVAAALLLLVAAAVVRLAVVRQARAERPVVVMPVPAAVHANSLTSGRGQLELLPSG